MVDLYAANQKYKKMKRRRKNRVVLKRVLTIGAVCVLTAALVAVSYFAVIPAVGGLISMLDVSSTVAAASDGNDTEETLPATADETEPETTAPTEPATEPPTEPPTEPQGEYIKPVIADDGTDGVLHSSTLYLWNGRGFNLFSSTDKVAKNYSKTINDVAKTLGDKVTVYNMVVPNQTEFGLPQRIIQSGIKTTPQSDNIKCIYDNLSKDIVKVNCYNALSAHANEYIYYNTDHHWTSLGAYYAYTAFCEQTGQKAVDINTLEKHSIPGFTGSFYTATGNSSLAANADTVQYYDMPVNTYAYMKERMSSDTLRVSMYYPASTGGSLTYGVFCWGDTAQFVIHSEANTGKKIAVVKDSYGNAFAPYLTANYDEVHLIDYRYWSGNLKDYMSKNGITEVLFLNNTMSANTPSQVSLISDSVS